MEIKSSFYATIAFGLLALAMLFCGGLALGAPIVSALAIVAAGLAYGSQWLATMALIVDERMYGPAVTSDNDGMYEALMRQAKRMRHFAILAQAASIVAGIIAFAMLAILAVVPW